MSITSFNSACFNATVSSASATSLSACSRLLFLGPTSFATELYTTIARTHLQIPIAAVEDFLIASGSKAGLSYKGIISVITASGILSLSKSIILFNSLGSDNNSFFDDSHQSNSFVLPSAAVFFIGFTSNIMHIACAVKITPGGGDFIPRTSPTSPLESLLRASTADSYAGIAAARSFSQSALMTPAFAFCVFAFSSSASTTVFFSSAAPCSFSTFNFIAPVSCAAFSRNGSSSVSSSCKAATCSLASAIFSKPVS
mmetsp:Transcript_54373/g.86425  ORF Transcript_54373/g.86425 Transcript_54373/m.86425 type:complete len:256 (-) Transcript_54373:2012-2779(-)